MTKITPEHQGRAAFVYVRQSTADQVLNNHESRRRQYALVDRARARPHGLAEGLRLQSLGPGRGNDRPPQTGDRRRLRSRTDQRQATEMNVGVAVLNRMPGLGHPKSVRIA